MRKIWGGKEWTKEDIEEERKRVKEQKIIFEMQIALEEEMVAYRNLVLKRLDEVVTLDDILDEMARKSLCGKISVWQKDRRPRHSPR